MVVVFKPKVFVVFGVFDPKTNVDEPVLADVVVTLGSDGAAVFAVAPNENIEAFEPSVAVELVELVVELGIPNATVFVDKADGLVATAAVTVGLPKLNMPGKALGCVCKVLASVLAVVAIAPNDGGVNVGNCVALVTFDVPKENVGGAFDSMLCTGCTPSDTAGLLVAGAVYAGGGVAENVNPPSRGGEAVDRLGVEGATVVDCCSVDGILNVTTGEEDVDTAVLGNNGFGFRSFSD